jgi:amidase
MAHDPLVFSSARELARLINTRQVSCAEVMNVHLQQVALVNPKVNAICTVAAEKALDAAKRADADLARAWSGRRKPQLPPLFGMPVGIKDLQLTAGIRTTFGSRIYKDFIPSEDALIVQRYKKAGAIVMGKTNTPEFGAGSHTFNEVFGKTLNPYDTTRTCGGSSGGSAVALACGMMPLASGSDLGGSLRNPAAWNNVVGIRPSVGRVPRRPAALGWSSLSVDGPMGRTVDDVALQMAAIAGPDPMSPMSIDEDPAQFSGALDWDPAAGRPITGSRIPGDRPARIAWSRDLGRYPIDPAVTAVVDSQRRHFESLGCVVEDAAPDLSDADEIFQAYRAYSFAQQHEAHLRQHRDLMKQTVIWNTEQGLKLSAMDMARAEEKRTRLHERVAQFFAKYDYLIAPTTSVPPFPAEQEYVTEINGTKLKTYIDWFAICYAITVTGCPSVSVPAGFVPPGLPLGLQVVAGPRQDMAALQLAYAFEQVSKHGQRRPQLAL